MMKEEHKLSHIIKEGFQDMFYIWKDELKQVFRDEGIMIFFFLVPLVYPVLYAYIYNNEVVHEAKMVVVDQSNSPLSREFIRRVDASSEVHVVQVVGEMEEARRLVDSKEAFGILSIPSAFSKDLHQGRQTTVSLYSDMSALLFYKAFLLTATEVSLEMGSEWTVRNHPQSTEALQSIAVQPIPSESISMYNPQNGFASFLVPAILILVIQQTLFLGIGMSAGTAREKNRFHTLVPITRHFHGTLQESDLHCSVCGSLCLGISHRASPVCLPADRSAVGSDSLYPALSVCVHLLLDDAFRLRFQPRGTDDPVCLYIGDPGVYFRYFLADVFDLSVLAGVGLYLPVHHGRTGFCPDQYNWSNPE